MNESLFQAGITAIGLCANYAFFRSATVPIVHAASWLIGMAFYLAASLLFLLIPGLFHTISVFFPLTIFVAISGVVAFRRRPPSRKDLFLMTVTMLLVMVTSLLLQIFEFNSWAGDSIYQILDARRIVYEDHWSSLVVMKFANWGLLAVLVQIPAAWLGIPYFSSMSPLALLFSLATFLIIIWESLSFMQVFGTLRVAITMIATGTLATCNIFMLLGVLIHNAVFANAYLFLCLGALWLSECHKSAAWRQLSLVAALAFVLGRIESPIFTTILLALFLFGNDVQQNFRLYVTTCSFANCVWWVVVACSIGTLDGISPVRALFLASLPLTLLPLVWLPERKAVQEILRHGVTATWIGLALLLLMCMLFRQQEMIHALKIMFVHLQHPNWGLFPPLLVVVGLLISPSPKIPYAATFRVGIPALFLIVAALGLFRIPYHSSTLDSANRIMAMLLAPGIFYFVLVLSGTGRTNDIPVSQADFRPDLENQ